VSRRMPINNRMGLGHDRLDPDLGAWVSDYRFSESNQRRFYQRWAELIEATDWGSMDRVPTSEAEHA